MFGPVSFAEIPTGGAFVEMVKGVPVLRRKSGPTVSTRAVNPAQFVPQLKALMPMATADGLHVLPETAAGVVALAEFSGDVRQHVPDPAGLVKALLDPDNREDPRATAAASWLADNLRDPREWAALAGLLTSGGEGWDAALDVIAGKSQVGRAVELPPYGKAARAIVGAATPAGLNTPAVKAIVRRMGPAGAGWRALAGDAVTRKSRADGLRYAALRELQWALSYPETTKDLQAAAGTRFPALVELAKSHKSAGVPLADPLAEAARILVNMRR